MMAERRCEVPAQRPDRILVPFTSLTGVLRLNKPETRVDLPETAPEGRLGPVDNRRWPGGRGHPSIQG